MKDTNTKNYTTLNYKTMKLNALLIMLAALIFVQACTTSKGNDEQQVATDVIPVTVKTIAKEKLNSTIQTSGVFTTDDETYLSFKTGGVIEKIFVKEGDAIKKGQLLARLNLTEIGAQVSQAKLAYEKAKRDFNRVENLYKDSVATLEQYQNAKTGMQVAQQQMDAANFNLSYSEIKALSDGFILRKIANEGQVITSGSAVFQTNGASQNKWKVRVGVSDREWALINIGDAAQVTTDATPDQTHEAFVSRKSEATDAMGGAFNIEVTLKNKSENLASGLFAKVNINSTKQQLGWRIPYTALLDGDAQTGYVFTTNDSKTVQKTVVTIGSITKDEVIITAGLEDKQSLIVSGSAYLKDGSSIKIIQ